MGTASNGDHAVLFTELSRELRRVADELRQDDGDQSALRQATAHRLDAYAREIEHDLLTAAERLPTVQSRPPPPPPAAPAEPAAGPDDPPGRG